MVTSLLQILLGAVIWQQIFTISEVPLKVIPEGEGYGTGVYNSAEDRLLQTFTFLCWAAFQLLSCCNKSHPFYPNLLFIYGINGSNWQEVENRQSRSFIVIKGQMKNTALFFSYIVQIRRFSRSQQNYAASSKCYCDTCLPLLCMCWHGIYYYFLPCAVKSLLCSSP